jgi:NAD-dependent dihydropyrimidine dehydrogenase PreA subunit
VTDEKLCNACKNCMISCPDFAIVVEKDPSDASTEKGDEGE